MHRRSPALPITALALILTVLALGAAATAQTPTPAQSEPDEELESWIDSLGDPGEGHQVLEAMIGRWEGTGSIWDGPASEPIPLTATIERHWVLGGRYLQEEVSIRTNEGEVFEALGFIGFNNEAAQYELLTIDNTSTSMLLETGRFDPDTKTLKIRGSFRDPATGFVLDRRVEMDLSQEGRIAVVGFTTNEEGREYKSLEGAVIRRKN